MTHQQAVTALASERYLLGEMSEIERYAFEEHYFECEACAQDVRIGAVMREGVRDGMLGAAAPAAVTAARTVDRSPWRHTVLPWAAAASLALVVGYQQFVGTPAAIDTQALAPITLRSATRGSDPVVQVRTNGVAAFAVDVDAAGTAAELTYALRNPEGAQVAAGRLQAPAAGSPVLLLVPESALRAPGRYLLSMRDATNTDSVATDYAFVVTKQ